MVKIAKGKKVVKAVAKPGIHIPSVDELNDPPMELSAYRILIYGKKAIGKTSIASRFPGAVVGMLERQRRGLKIRQVPLKDWDDCIGFRDACLEDDTVETLVFDTVDILYDLCLEAECRSRGVSHPSDIPNDFGTTWKAIKQSFRDFFDPISDSQKGMVVLSHEKKDTMEVRTGNNYDILIPSCSGQAFSVIEETFDIILYYGLHGTDRAISIRPLSEGANTEVTCGCNPEGVFMDPSGQPISIFTVPTTPQGAYETLNSAFHNEVWDTVRGKPQFHDLNSFSEVEGGKKKFKIGKGK